MLTKLGTILACQFPFFISFNVLYVCNLENGFPFELKCCSCRTSLLHVDKAEDLAEAQLSFGVFRELRPRLSWSSLHSFKSSFRDRLIVKIVIIS